MPRPIPDSRREGDGDSQVARSDVIVATGEAVQRELARAHFRPANAADLDELLGLVRAFNEESGYPFAEPEMRVALFRLLKHPELGRVWVADDRGPRDRGPSTLVAYVAVTLGFSLEYLGHDAFVDEVYVAPSHRRMGLGSAALRVAEADCRARGVRALHLEVERDRESAFALYRRHGFVDHDRFLMTRVIGADR